MTKIGVLLDHIHALDTNLAAELRSAGERHADDHDVYHQCLTFAVTADKRLIKLASTAERYGGKAEWKSAINGQSDDLLEDLRLLFLRTEEAVTTWLMASQAAKAARGRGAEAARHRSALRSRNAGEVVPNTDQDKYAAGVCGGIVSTPGELPARVGGLRGSGSALADRLDLRWAPPARRTVHVDPAALLAAGDWRAAALRR